MSRNPARSLLARTPLRVQLVVAVVLLAAIGLTATGLLVTTQIRGYLVGQVDKDLQQLAQRPPPNQGNGGPDGSDGSAPFETSRDEYYAIATTSGKVIPGNVQSTNKADPPALSPGQIRSAAGHGPFTVPADGRGASWRVVVRLTQAHAPGSPVVVPVLYVRAVSLADVVNTTHRLV
ncbi:MAG TPA: hypothetical protein VGO19_10390, partial [Actinomycetes bacterium]